MISFRVYASIKWKKMLLKGSTNVEVSCIKRHASSYICFNNYPKIVPNNNNLHHRNSQLGSHYQTQGHKSRRLQSINLTRDVPHVP